MKAIQVMFEETLIKKLDETAEAKEKGRSAVLRRLTDEYLRKLHQEDIARRYSSAYGDEKGLGESFEGWEDQGRWPSE